MTIAFYSIGVLLLVVMIIGWYVLGFDIPTIIKRLIVNGINPKKLSPHREVRGVSHNRIYNVKYSNTAQPIKGRITYCLMTRFERLWLIHKKEHYHHLN